MVKGNNIELVNGHFICADCKVEIQGVGGMVGMGRNAKIYCLKHYWEHKKKK